MAKLNLTLMSIIAAMAAAGCGQGEKKLMAEQAAPAPVAAAALEAKPAYADVNGMKVYYETLGSGEPVMLLHGAYMSAESMRPVANILARTRMVIVPEAQGHARTADIDRPITYEAMADDVAALMDHLKIQSADVVGYSMGAGTAIQLAIRHPGKVERMVAASASHNTEGMYPEIVAMFPTITPAVFAGSPMETEYKKLSPTPGKFPQFVEKLKALDVAPFDWPAKDIAAIKAPTLIVVGDQDIVTPEHAVSMLRLLGGGKPGDMGQPAPEDQLAILPGTSHVNLLFAQGETFAKMAADFIDPKPPAPSPFGPPPEAPAQPKQ